MDFKNPECITEFLKYQKSVLRKYIFFVKEKVRTDYKHAAIFVYWLDEYLKYIEDEKNFNPARNMKYKRGQIVLVNFGHRIGSELGGNHYAIVIDNKNSRYSNTVTVMPLKSKKEKITKYAEIYHVSLGHLIGKMIYSKSLDIYNEYLQQAKKVETNTMLRSTDKKVQVAKLKRMLRISKETMEYSKKMNIKESVADTGQLITISKQRIITPAKDREPLAGIILSPDIMGEIDEKLRYLYLDNS